MKKVLVIVGPTAIGKSSFAIEATKRFDGEIISGDSIQIYRGLDIGSGKVSEQERKMAVHHLIDTKNPHERYSVKEFQEDCRRLIDDIAGRGKMPIICGGTGLYIKAALYDYEFKEEERQMDLFEDIDDDTLYEKLKQVDPVSAEKIHPHNRRRVVRALNIYYQNNEAKSSIEKRQTHTRIYDTLYIGLTAKRETVYQNIEKRVSKMFEQGLEQEIKNLLASGVDFDSEAFKGIGYKEFKEYFQGNMTLAEVKDLIIRNSKKYAKRQYTWFNNQEEVSWFERDDWEEAFRQIGEWYHE